MRLSTRGRYAVMAMVELAARQRDRGEGGRVSLGEIAEAQALDHVYGYAVGLDMTRRDLQRAMGDEKKPWEIGKSFDMSAPIGPLSRAPIERITRVLRR